MCVTVIAVQSGHGGGVGHVGHDGHCTGGGSAGGSGQTSGSDGGQFPSIQFAGGGGLQSMTGIGPHILFIHGMLPHIGHGQPGDVGAGGGGDGG